MKNIFYIALATSVLVSQLSANEIIIFKAVNASKSTFIQKWEDLDPFALLYSSSYSSTSYLVVDKTSKQYVVVNYYTAGGYSGGPGRKEMSILPAYDTPNPLSFLFDAEQPLRGGIQRLWNYRFGGQSSSQDDTDLDTVNDLFYTDYWTGFITGIGLPVPLATGVTLSNAPAKCSGTEVANYVFRQDATVDASKQTSFEHVLTNTTYTLDVVLTKAANLSSIVSTGDDIMDSTDTPLMGTLNAGTLTNGIQRVRNALYTLGYRFPAPVVP